MPACDMSASRVMRAPETGFVPVSANLRVTVAGPTRGGSGEIACSIMTAGDESIGPEQLVANPATTQESTRKLKRIWVGLRNVPRINPEESQAADDESITDSY